MIPGIALLTVLSGIGMGVEVRELVRGPKDIRPRVKLIGRLLRDQRAKSQLRYVLAIFVAEGCIPCTAMGLWLAERRARWHEIEAVTVGTSSKADLCIRNLTNYGVKKFPTFVLFDNADNAVTVFEGFNAELVDAFVGEGR